MKMKAESLRKISKTEESILIYNGLLEKTTNKNDII